MGRLTKAIGHLSEDEIQRENTGRTRKDGMDLPEVVGHIACDA